MHSVAFGKAFQTMCLDFSFATDQNPLIFDKTKGYNYIALCFFHENEQFL